MKLSVDISPGAMLLGALLLLTIPTQWLFSALLAAAFHELFHILAVHFIGGRILSLRITGIGAQICIAPLAPTEELLCVLAGPVGSLLLFSCIRWIPRIALCSGFHAVFNLLPIGGLDGSAILSCIASMLFPRANLSAVKKFAEYFALAAAGLLSLLTVLFFRMGILPLFVTAWALYHASQKNSLQTGSYRSTIV